MPHCETKLEVHRDEVIDGGTATTHGIQSHDRTDLKPTGMTEPAGGSTQRVAVIVGDLRGSTLKDAESLTGPTCHGSVTCAEGRDEVPAAGRTANTEGGSDKGSVTRASEELKLTAHAAFQTDAENVGEPVFAGRAETHPEADVPTSDQPDVQWAHGEKIRPVVRDILKRLDRGWVLGLRCVSRFGLRFRGVQAQGKEDHDDGIRDGRRSAGPPVCEY